MKELIFYLSCGILSFLWCIAKYKLPKWKEIWWFLWGMILIMLFWPIILFLEIIHNDE